MNVVLRALPNWGFLLGLCTRNRNESVQGNKHAISCFLDGGPHRRGEHIPAPLLPLAALCQGWLTGGCPRQEGELLPRDQTTRGAGAVQALAVPNLGYLWLLSQQTFVCLEIFADSSIPSVDSVSSFLHWISFIWLLIALSLNGICFSHRCGVRSGLKS